MSRGAIHCNVHFKIHVSFFQYNMLPTAKASEQSVGIVSNAISPSVTNLGLFRANDEGVARAQVVFLS